ncbi:hypothetical protein [Actinoplanes sp. NPDC049316]|uniref:hypothetical protein n=1 Tax=Actinoplanes sp. NPDC049316 TaxID=3154727 RepID=UPI003443830C
MNGDTGDAAGTPRPARAEPGDAAGTPRAGRPAGATALPPLRTRVVLGEAAAARRASPDSVRAELAEQTPVGEALVKGLVRAQLALAVRLSLVVVAGLGALPLLFAVAPAVGRVKVLGVNLPWLLLGLLSFPFLLGVGWAYVRWAERNEQDFTAVIRRPEA